MRGYVNGIKKIGNPRKKRNMVFGTRYTRIRRCVFANVSVKRFRWGLTVKQRKGIEKKND